MVKNGKKVCFIILTHLFFISFIINLFIVFYSIYSLTDMIIFHNTQGSILNVKRKTLNIQVIILKFLKSKFFILLFSIFISIILLIIFKPILTAQDVTFPYSIHPFSISKSYPTVWLYIKIIYFLNLFIVNFLFVNSITSYFKFNKKSKITNTNKKETIESDDNIRLLIGDNSETKEKIFISEKGLYQNILVTGTIGSRQNKFCNVSIFKAIYGV